jgi:hypothetical protein
VYHVPGLCTCAGPLDQQRYATIKSVPAMNGVSTIAARNTHNGARRVNFAPA